MASVIRGSDNFNSDRASASFYCAATGVTLDTSYGIVDIDSTSKNAHSSIFTLSGNRVTINKTATFIIFYTITTDVTSGNSRSNSQVALHKDGLEVAGTLSGLYNRNTGSGLNTGSGTIIIDVTSGSILDIRALKIGTDTITQVANGTNLTFLEL